MPEQCGTGPRLAALQDRTVFTQVRTFSRYCEVGAITFLALSSLPVPHNSKICTKQSCSAPCNAQTAFGHWPVHSDPSCFATIITGISPDLVLRIRAESLLGQAHRHTKLGESFDALAATPNEEICIEELLRIAKQTGLDK